MATTDALSAGGTRSSVALARARRSIAGGDSSTMRVLPYHLPLVAQRGEGARVWDVDGREYLDLNMAYGPLLFGHRPQRIIDAVVRQISESGSQLGFPTEISVRAAENIQQLFPGMELLRFANSGTEALASAVRLARTVTGRERIVLFEGHYHGWSEALFHRYHAPLDQLPTAGYGPALPGTLGMNGGPREAVVCRWNDLDALERCLAEHRGQVAAVVMEPVMGNAGVIPPEEGFLHQVREWTLDEDALLIFDEVITGMRVAAGGAQELYLVQPDITVISKVLGAGYPVAAFGASRSLMEPIESGRLFHGGVYSGNAAVMAAAEAATGEILERRASIYPALWQLADELARGLGELLTRLRVPHCVQHVGPMVSLLLTRDRVDRLTHYRQVRRHCDFDAYIRFQHNLQRHGVYLHPNQFEPMFLSTAHTSADIQLALERAEDAARACLVG